MAINNKKQRGGGDYARYARRGRRWIRGLMDLKYIAAGITTRENLPVLFVVVGIQMNEHEGDDNDRDSRRFLSPSSSLSCFYSRAAIFSFTLLDWKRKRPAIKRQNYILFISEQQQKMKGFFREVHPTCRQCVFLSWKKDD